MPAPKLNIETDFIVNNQINGDILERFYESPHKTNVLIFALCLKGRIRTTINLIHYEIMPNDMVVIAPDTFIQINKMSDNIQLNVMMFSSAFIQKSNLEKSVIDMFYVVNNYRVISLPTKVFRIYIETLIVLQHVQQDARYLLNDTSLRYTLQMFLQSITEICQRKAHSNETPESKHFGKYRLFLRLVQTHYTRQHQVQFYAKEIGLKPATLCRIVKQESGQTAMDFINAILIIDAKTSLRATSTPVKDIALNLGFNNAAFFNKFFKKHVGMTPQIYRMTPEK